jgi:hypothetical protein
LWSWIDPHAHIVARKSALHAYAIIASPNWSSQKKIKNVLHNRAGGKHRRRARRRAGGGADRGGGGAGAAAGAEARAIADKLNADGHTTHRGRPWNPVRVTRVLERAKELHMI